MIRSRVIPLAVAGALVLVACGSNPPTASPVGQPPSDGPSLVTDPSMEPSAAATPASAATPTPAPSAAPDVAAAFADIMGDPLFSAHVTLSGTARVGSTASATTGTIDLGGSSSRVVITTRTGKASTTARTVTANGIRYVQTHGVWFNAGDPVLNDLPALVLAIDGTVTDLGVETIDGVALHHLSVAPPAPFRAALSLTTKGISNIAGTVDAWTQEDGTPAKVTLAATWKQVVGKKKVAGRRMLDLAFANVGGSIDINAPAQVWRWATSTRYGYRLAYPSDWQFQKGAKSYLDSYFGFDGDAVFAYRFKSYGLSLTRLSSEVKRQIGKITGFTSVKVASTKAAKLGALPAKVMELSGKYKGIRHWWIVDYAVKGGWVYWVEFRTDTKTTGADRAMAAAFAGTHSPK